MATEWPIQKQGSSGEAVRTVQHLLDHHGARLAADGDFGPLTKAAVQQFQGARGLAADGIVGNLTWPALVVQVKTASNGQAVRAVQSQVNARAKLLVVDGIFGPETDQAVRSFQGPAGLAVDGIVGPLTWHALVSGVLSATSGEEANKAVFSAWTKHDQAAARRHATSTAVAQLFARTWSAADGWTFDHCSGAAGSVFCRWQHTGGMLTLRANNNTGAPFFFVTSASFQP